MWIAWCVTKFLFLLFWLRMLPTWFFLYKKDKALVVFIIVNTYWIVFLNVNNLKFLYKLFTQIAN